MSHMFRCEYCEDLEYPCAECDERAYMAAGERDLHREMSARINRVMRR